MTSTSSVTSGLTMLTSGVSQYLHPDYLQPLPTTLDAKKSPLALLAQTCSAIGKDTSPSKSIIPPLEKNNKDNSNEKSSIDRSGDSDSSSNSSKRPSSHGHKDRDSNSSSKPGFRTFPPKEIPPLVPISSNGENSTGSKSGRMSSAEPKPATSPLMNAGATTLTVPSSLPRPVSANSAPRTASRGSNGKGEGSDHHHHHHHHHHNGSHHHQQQHSSSSNHHAQHSSSHHHRQRDSPVSSGSSSSSSSSSSSQQPRPSSSPSYSKPSSSHATSVMHSPSSINSSSSSAMKQQATHASHASMLGGLPAHLAGYPNPLALMGHGLDASSYHSALAAHSSLSSYSAAAAAAAAQSSALKAAAAGGSAAALSPFVTYARVRTPSGATTLVPVCRDPYCTNCQLTVQNSHLSSTCNAPGCAQCAHEKSLTSLSALSLPSAAAASSMLLPPLSSAGSALTAGSMSALSSLHSLYPHSALAAAAAAHQGLPYVCNWVAGSDYCGKRFNSSEELLQHLRTHTSSLDVSSLAASYAGLGGLPSALGAYPHLSAPLSPNSLRRAYPTSLSPVSSLLSASRYHPYKSPLSGVGAPPPQSLPPVGPYYSPYTLYGQRIGAAVVP
ncbi:Zinc finger protein noc [Plakobranchus ocellatus]|uniref:Zinc finger protein noc n=1 Tax=Plakobranchus ocellatus TaxID=259542 RepID=A0AAV4D4E1_9GAST|nr:Zinc finger protein noc [Plakobranchus ocellatus]